jgi:hypothetical protein
MLKTLLVAHSMFNVVAEASSTTGFRPHPFYLKTEAESSFRNVVILFII